MSAGGRTMAETTMHIGIGEEAVVSVKAEFQLRMKSVRAARRNLGRLRDDLVRHNSMDRKTVIMSENFLIDNHCENVKKLVEIGFEFDDTSAFSMNGTLTKKKKSFYLHLFPLDGIALLSDDTSDVKSPDFMSDTCRTWDELLNALVRRKAITKKVAQEELERKLKEKKK